MLLKNKTAVITGSNSGIGNEILKIFLANGIKQVFACVRDKKKFLQEINNYKKKFQDTKIELIEFDLKDEKSIINASKEVLSISNNIDILVNNAAEIENSYFLMTPLKNIKKTFEVNFFSQLLLIQYISKKMIKNKSGSIINISSTSARDGDEGRLAYSTSKSALSTSTKVLARELARFNIRCNNVSPGMTETKMLSENTDAKIIEQRLNNVSLNRLAKPKDIANVVLFLASEMSSYITGETINVDGGT